MGKKSSKPIRTGTRVQRRYGTNKPTFTKVKPKPVRPKPKGVLNESDKIAMKNLFLKSCEELMAVVGHCENEVIKKPFKFDTKLIHKFMRNNIYVHAKIAEEKGTRFGFEKEMISADFTNKNLVYILLINSKSVNKRWKKLEKKMNGQSLTTKIIFTFFLDFLVDFSDLSGEENEFLFDMWYHTENTKFEQFGSFKKSFTGNQKEEFLDLIKNNLREGVKN